MKKIFISLLIMSGSFCATAQRTFPVIKYGAKPGLTNNNAKAIQSAIDAAAKSGGKVIIPAGNFMTGPIVLKSNVELHLDKDAVLLGSTNRMDYALVNPGALITCYNQENIKLTGPGVIDGQGRDVVTDALNLLNDGKIQDDPEWLVKRPTEKNRPNLVFFKGCRNVTVKNIVLKNSASWVQNYKECTNVLIDSMRVESTAYWNNDGIDIVDSKEVKITNSYFNAADDAICLKSEINDGFCENVLIENCVARSSANGFKIGTGSLGGFKNITVSNLLVFNTYRSAIAIETVDGAFVENIKVSNVRAKNTGNALFIRLGHRNKSDKYSSVNNVLIENVQADIPLRKPDMGYPVEGPTPKVPPHNLVPSSITGLPGHIVKNVVLQNIEITYGGGASKEKAYVALDTLGGITENVAGYPEFNMFGELPSWGLYVRHAEGITLKNFKVKLAKEDFRPAFIFDDVKGLQLDAVSVPSNNTLPAVVYRNTENITAQSLSIPASDKAILTLKQ